tara:strand:+ start:1103 stop:1468 length:366 start_codon:yes stop_codon:yes gene_type:complete
MSNKITQEDKDELYQEKNLTGQLGNTKFYQSDDNKSKGSVTQTGEDIDKRFAREKKEKARYDQILKLIQSGGHKNLKVDEMEALRDEFKILKNKSHIRYQKKRGGVNINIDYRKKKKGLFK